MQDYLSDRSTSGFGTKAFFVAVCAHVLLAAALYMSSSGKPEQVQTKAAVASAAPTTPIAKTVAQKTSGKMEKRP